MGHSSTTSGARRACGMLGVLAAGMALAGCPTVDLGDSPPDIGLCQPDMQYFENQIWPNYLAPADMTKSCVQIGCHEAESGRSGLRLKTTLPIDYANNYLVATQYLNCGTPDASELLTKPLAGIEAHVGGDIFANESDPAVVIFLGWFHP